MTKAEFMALAAQNKTAAIETLYDRLKAAELKIAALLKKTK